MKTFLILFVLIFVGFSSNVFCKTTPKDDNQWKNKVLVNWYSPVQRNSILSTETEILVQALTENGIDVSVHPRDKGEIGRELSETVKDCIAPLSSGISQRLHAKTFQELKKEQRSKKRINVAISGVEELGEIRAIPGHYNILRLRFFTEKKEIEASLIHQMLRHLNGWDELWITSSYLKKQLKEEFEFPGPIFLLPPIVNTSFWVPRDKTLTPFQIEYLFHHPPSSLNSSIDSQNLLSSPTTTTTSMTTQNASNAESDDGMDHVESDDESDNAESGRSGLKPRQDIFAEFPYASFRMVAPIDMTDTEWAGTPQAFLRMKTTESDGASLVLFVLRPPRPNMTRKEVILFIEEKLDREIKAATDQDLRISFESEDGEGIILPPALPPTIQVVYPASQVSDADYLRLLQSSHLFLALTMNLESLEAGILKALAVELPVLSFELGFGAIYLDESKAFLIPDTSLEGPPVFGKKEPVFSQIFAQNLISDLMQPQATGLLREVAQRAGSWAKSKFSIPPNVEKIVQRLNTIVEKILPGKTKVSAPSPYF